MSADRMSEDDFVWLSYRGLEGFRPLFMQAIDWALRVKPKDRPQNISEWQASFGWSPRAGFPGRGVGRPALTARTKAAMMAGNKTTPHPPHQTSKAAPTAQPDAARSNTTRSPTVTVPELRILKTVRRFPFIVPVLLFLATSGLLTVVGGGLSLLTRPSQPTLPLAGEAPEPASSPTAAAPTAAHKSAVFENSLGMKFMPVPGTNLLFSVWDTRVQDYRAFVQATGRAWAKPSFPQEVNHPAVNVSWEDTQAFCKWLAAKEGREYRLPTDTEWSLAAGLPVENGSTPKEKDGGVKNTYPWGIGWPPPKGAGNYNRALLVDDYEKTSPVGAFPENRYGLYDLSGNVWQWCEDWYDNFQRRRVLRGGAWNSCTQDILLSSFRYYSYPADQYDNIGFRCVTPAKKTESPR